ncbi:MAG TPA: hypothetical protein V6C58_24695 [Allocoleopsis sp.]
MAKLIEIIKQITELLKSLLFEVEKVEQKNNDEKLIKEICDFIEEIIHTGKNNPFTKTAYMNFKESNGNNRSKDIDEMNKRNGVSLGAPYCMTGIQDIMRAVEKKFNVKFDLPATPSTQEFWTKSKTDYKLTSPKTFTVAIFRKGETWQGHAALCLGAINSQEFSTFEFNTSPQATSEIIRDGEGCYFKVRPVAGYGDMKLRGFVDIFKSMKKL